MSRDRKVGVFFTIFALVLMFVWVPRDVDSGLIETVRRQVSIGDALAPSIAGVFLLLGGLGLVLSGRQAGDMRATTDLVALRFSALLFAVYAAGFLVMTHAGPAAVLLSNLLTGAEQEYRLLRDTAPWKYLGFTLGGVIAVGGTISLLEGRLSWRAPGIGLVMVLALIAVYDLPFDDLLLPPNGDV